MQFNSFYFTLHIYKIIRSYYIVLLFNYLPIKCIVFVNATVYVVKFLCINALITVKTFVRFCSMPLVV